ncbi:MAG: hypothetical protein IIT46_07875 [Lachnospiraceae bacterium]|nr:hypothetical protein [Lachnospiraceae bacterium]
MINKNLPLEQMLDMPHPTSKNHPRMSMYNRAAQFASFDALTGYKSAISETGRKTEALVELTEDEIQRINDKLAFIAQNLPEQVEVEITYFVLDQKKEGGAYEKQRDVITKIDYMMRHIVTEHAGMIPMEYLISIEFL